MRICRLVRKLSQSRTQVSCPQAKKVAPYSLAVNRNFARSVEGEMVMFGYHFCTSSSLCISLDLCFLLTFLYGVHD